MAAIKPSGDYFYSAADNELYFSTPVTLSVTYTVRQKLEADSAAGGYVEKDETYTICLSSGGDGTLYAKTDAESALIYQLAENGLWEFAK